MVFKIFTTPENSLTQVIAAPDLSRAHEIAQGIEERYENVEPYDLTSVRIFMPLAYAEGFEDRITTTDFASDDPWIIRHKGRDWMGFTCFDFYGTEIDDIEAVINMAPECAAFVPLEGVE